MELDANFSLKFVLTPLILLFPEIRMTKKIFTRVAPKNYFINSVEFSKESLHLESYSNSTFLC